jgi:hypothetical protein
MRLLTIRAFCRLAAFDFRQLNRNFASLCESVRSSKVADRTVPTDITASICDAVNHACVWYPKRVRCLQRSVVTTRMLRSYGVPACMVVGAQKLPFKAHAWVEINGMAVNERADVQVIYSVWERC